MEQAQVDQRNAAFWSELCGTGMARALGITGESPDALQRFDDAYFGFYPYLAGYVDRFDVSDRAVLEIGLGYGTLGQYLAEQGARYHGLDIAPDTRRDDAPPAPTPRPARGRGRPPGAPRSTSPGRMRPSTTSTPSVASITRGDYSARSRRSTACSRRAASPW